MAPSLDDIRKFASGPVLGSLKERYQDTVFSRDLWREMGGLGLLGISVPEELGGSGGTPGDIAGAVSEFAQAGNDMGLTLSWITHLALCVKSIEYFGTAAQKAEYLPRLLSGEWVGAAAVSEPRTGAHPAGIETTARRVGGGFRLDGSKMYVTDGPVADLLVVVAATGETAGGMKELTAFLVETGRPGFEATVMEMNFLKTSPHGQLTFDGMELAEDAILGRVGDGHSQASRSAFARERSLVLSAFVGLFGAAADECGSGFVRKHGSFKLDGNEANAWIHHMAALAAYRRLVPDLVDVAFTDPERWRGMMDLLIYLGISYAKWGAWLGDFVVRHQVEPAFTLDIMLNDMKLVLVGEGIIYKEGRRRYIQPYDKQA
jgi:hypothetical protein